MNEKLKNYFAGAIIIAILAIAFSALSAASSYRDSIGPGSLPSFATSGQGKVVAIPDVAEVTFQVTTEGGKDLVALERDNTTKTNKGIAFAISKGVAKKDITTEAYSVEPRYQYFSCRPSPANVAAPCPPAEIVGYTVSQSVRLKIRNLAQAGEIVAGLVKNGANSVSNLNFTVDDPKALEAEARGQAIADAKAKAKAVAKAGGFGLGRLLSISESGGSVMPMLYNKDMRAEGLAVSASAPTPTIEPGSQDIIVNVSVQYEIKN